MLNKRFAHFLIGEDARTREVTKGKKSTSQNGYLENIKHEYAPKRNNEYLPPTVARNFSDIFKAGRPMGLVGKNSLEFVHVESVLLVVTKEDFSTMEELMLVH